MQFERLDEAVIRCIITKKELDEAGVNVEDLMHDRDKAEELLRHVMMEARYELDFKLSGQALSVQINIMPQGDLALTISDKNNIPQGLLHEILKGDLENALAQVRQLAGATETANDSRVVEIPANASTGFNGPAWLKVDNLDDVMTVAHNMSKTKIIMSQLYKYRDDYYLRFELKDADSVSYIFLAASEYSDRIFLDNNGGDYIIEHGTCIIAEDAIDVLASI